MSIRQQREINQLRESVAGLEAIIADIHHVENDIQQRLDALELQSQQKRPPGRPKKANGKTD